MPLVEGEGGGGREQAQHTQIGGNRVHSWDARVSALQTHMRTQGFRAQREPSEATANPRRVLVLGLNLKTMGREGQ